MIDTCYVQRASITDWTTPSCFDLSWGFLLHGLTSEVASCFHLHPPHYTLMFLRIGSYGSCRGCLALHLPPTFIWVDVPRKPIPIDDIKFQLQHKMSNRIAKCQRKKGLSVYTLQSRISSEKPPIEWQDSPEGLSPDWVLANCSNVQWDTPRIVFGLAGLTLGQCMQRSNVVHRIDNLFKHSIE